MPLHGMFSVLVAAASTASGDYFDGHQSLETFTADCFIRHTKFEGTMCSNFQGKIV